MLARGNASDWQRWANLESTHRWHGLKSLQPRRSLLHRSQALGTCNLFDDVVRPPVASGDTAATEPAAWICDIVTSPVNPARRRVVVSVPSVYGRREDEETSACVSLVFLGNFLGVSFIILFDSSVKRSSLGAMQITLLDTVLMTFRDGVVSRSFQASRHRRRGRLFLSGNDTRGH